MWTVCLRLLPDSVVTAISTRALLRLSPARWSLGYRATPKVGPTCSGIVSAWHWFSLFLDDRKFVVRQVRHFYISTVCIGIYVGGADARKSDRDDEAKLARLSCRYCTGGDRRRSNRACQVGSRITQLLNEDVSCTCIISLWCRLRYNLVIQQEPTSVFIYSTVSTAVYLHVACFRGLRGKKLTNGANFANWDQKQTNDVWYFVKYHYYGTSVVTTCCRLSLGGRWAWWTGLPSNAMTLSW